jgi:hypothetical protein
VGDFHGLLTRGLQNEHLRIEFLAEAGPRIVRLSPAGSDENLLAEVPDMTWDTPSGTFFIRGGHRLWHAPESFPRTYGPDNEGLVVEGNDGGVLLSRPTEATTGIQKSVQIQLYPDRAALALHHRLENRGAWPVELAAWAITQVPLGGIAVLPQYGASLDKDGLGPNRNLVLWPYTRVSDARLQLGDDLVLMRGEAELPPCKVGYLNRRGWIGYLRSGTFFCKRFEPRPDAPHVDFGCNVEVYCGDRFLELETLGPSTRLEPGQAVTHDEVWEVFAGIDAPPTDDGARSVIQALGLA